MADNDKARTPEDIEKELSVGKFAGQQARTLGFTLGGAALGAGAAWLLGRVTGLGGKLGKLLNRPHMSDHGNHVRVFFDKPEEIQKLGEGIIAGAGGVVGLLTGGMASNYEHWAKVERERLSVQEINKDVANLMEKRVQFEDTLDKQHRIVQEMLNRRGFSGDTMQEREQERREKSASAERTGP